MKSAHVRTQHTSADIVAITHFNMAHLPEDDLPSNFDIVVDGTGLVQSILAAALARAGKSILHIDRERYYGEQWASLMHRELVQWMDDLKQSEVSTVVTENSDAPLPPPNEDWVTVKQVVPGITNIHQVVPDWMPKQNELSPNQQDMPQSAREATSDDHSAQSDVNDVSTTEDGELREEPTNSVEMEAGQGRVGQPVGGASATNQMTELNWEQMGNLKRRFTYDLLPKVLYCRGTLVELLTSSNCGRYVEFKAVGKIFTQVNGELELVPCSRADMFSTKSLSMVDKRKMMRFLSFCSEYKDHPEQYQEFENVPFVEFLTKNDLEANLRQYIIHCIAMVDETTPTIKALEATRLFLSSLGRFGNAPFLYPIFGVGELAQAFCRLCAVFGGVYCLSRYIKTLVVSSDNHKIKAIICSTGQRISCSAAVCSITRLTNTFQFNEALTTCQLSRAIFITDGPIQNTHGALASVSLPPSALGTQQVVPIRMLQLDSSTSTAVPGTYMIHAMCSSVGSSAEVDLRPVCIAYFSTPDEVYKDRPRLLYSLYFNVKLNSLDQTTSVVDGLPDNVLLTSDPAPTMTFEGAVAEAQHLFSRLCPGEQFLAPPPDPDDIIYDEPSTPEDIPSYQSDVPSNQPEAASNEPEVPSNQPEITSNQQRSD